MSRFYQAATVLKNQLSRFGITNRASFESVADAIVANYLTVGMKVKTTAYRSGWAARLKGAEGGASYNVVTKAQHDVIRGVSVVDEKGDHTLFDGSVLLLVGRKVRATQYGVTTDGLDSREGLQKAVDRANRQNLKVVLPEGDIGLSGKIVIARSGSDFIGFSMVGGGRSRTTFKPLAWMDYVFEITVSGGFSLNNNLSGFGIDFDGAPATMGALRLNAGVWRSSFDDLYFRRSGVIRTGRCIFGGSESDSDKGFYDNKFSRLYLSGFATNLCLVGTELDGNTVTNVTLRDSYLGNSNTNVFLNYFNGYWQSGTQLESHVIQGALFNNGDSANIQGGSIESNIAGAIGVNMDANTKSVIANTDFFNNDGGNFKSNGKKGHYYKNSQSGQILPAGGELVVGSDGVNNSRVRFFRDGVADLGIRVSSGGNAFSVVDSADNEVFKFDVTNRILDVIDAGIVRLNNDSNIIFKNDGVEVFWGLHDGSPEGVIESGVGGFCVNRNTGDIYTKKSGGGASGWL